MRNAGRSLFMSVIALLLCFSMLLGLTWAWFTDSATSDRNTIEAGNLDVELEYRKDGGAWKTVDEDTNVFKNAKWEPGYTEVVYLRVTNAGTLALKYLLSVKILEETASINVNGVAFRLSDFIKIGGVDDVETPYASRSEAKTAATGVKGLREGYTKVDRLAKNEADYVALVLYIPESVGNEANAKKGEATPKIDLGLRLVATQVDEEGDSFGSDFDKEVGFPALRLPGSITESVSTDADGKLANDVVIKDADETIVAEVPEDVQLTEQAGELSFSVSEMESSGANITLADKEILRSLDVHIEGVATTNTVPIRITIKQAMMPGLNLGNFTLYHVEGGIRVAMTRVASLAELDAHNEFVYDPATGDVILSMATFSEVAIVADTENAWAGSFDYDWYDADATELTIANADQLAAFGAIVGGMNGKTQDSFAGKTVKLLANINLGDKESENNPDLIFYPIGYYNNTGSYNKVSGKVTVNGEEVAVSSYYQKFMGTFDGNGNTIANFYQNTWEMFGDYNDGYSGTPNHSRDGMGLFGNVYGGTVKNLTVKNFSSDGEYATTGVIAAYADSGNGKSATFENITIFNCNPRVYNIGNGGIVGCAGWYSRNDGTASGYPVTFKNITVDQSNKISALWGSYDVSCGGILGQYYPDSQCGVSFENCHIAAIMDVNNDVCANYQYYWYRYSGMLIGTIRANTTDGKYTVADTTGITVTGCTYTLGDWNEYWYCELVRNSLASYTHDHQFSRLTKIASLSEIQDGAGNWSKEGNFVIPAADNSSAECYHIFKDSEGKLYQHFHDKADASNPNIYESFDLDGNGKLDDLKEDRQCYYMPFNQVFNGLGYGVKPTYAIDGLTEKKDGPVTSEEKFVNKNVITTYRPGQTITLGNLISAIVDESKISKATLYVAASPATENDVINASVSMDIGTWANSTITFAEDCQGSAKIVITDYFFCSETVIYLSPEQAAEKFTANTAFVQNAYTSITLGDLFAMKNGATLGSITATVTDPNGVETTITATNSEWQTKAFNLIKEGDYTVVIKDDDAYCSVTTATFTVNKAAKFEPLFTNNYLYRVGNIGTVAWSTLFKDLSPAIAPVGLTVTIENIAGNAAGTFTDGSIQFTNTGIVCVTISADGANAVSLKLEVVEAVNATNATSATSNNVVLLKDCGFSSLEVANGYTLFGNGFTLTCGSDSAALDMGYAFVTLDSGTLDNVQIICPNFDYAVLYKTNMTESGNRSETTDKTRYFNVKSGVMASGNSQILNSRISGARAAVNVTSGNCVIDNSHIELGAVASLLVGAANSVTLKDVTLVQKPTASTYDSSKILMGFSTLILCNSSGDAAKITIEGELVQNAWAKEADKQYVPSAGQNLVSTALQNKDYLHDIDGDGVNESLNLGFAYMPETANGAVNAATIKNNDNRTNKAAIPYDLAEVTTTYVYSYKNTNGTADAFKTDAEYKPNKYGAIVTVSYNDSADGLESGKSFGTDGWVYELNVDLDKRSGYAVDFGNLSMMVNGVVVTDFLVNGSKPTSPIAVVAGGTTYTLTATVDGVEHTAYFKVIGTETTKESPSLIASNYEAALLVGEAGNTLTKDTWHGAAPALKGIQIKYWSVAEKQYKTINLEDYTPTTAGKQNGTNTTWTYSPANGDFTLTLTGGQVHSSNNVSAMPVVVNSTLYFVGASSSGLVNYGNSARTIPVSYSFKDNNGGTVLSFSHTWSIECENGNTCYDYSDFVDGTSKTFTIVSSNGNVCVTGDTLVTLADGTQKRIDQATYNDQLLVWNFFTGAYDVVPSAIIFNHGMDEYNVLILNFEDGTTVKVLNNHGFYDVQENQFVFIDEYNANDYLGHSFVKVDGDSYKAVKLTSYELVLEYTGSYSIQTAIHNNFMVEGLFSITMPHYEGWFDYFEIGEGMKYDEDKMQADIEKYGLYTYEDFAEYVTYEQFIAFNGPYLKVLVGRGVVTYEQIIDLIGMYVNP